MKLDINIDKLQKGDESEFVNFYTDYFPYFSLFVAGYLKSKEHNRDIVQDVFLEYWKKRRDFSDPVSLKVFFYRSLRNRCLNEIRRSSAKQHYSIDDIAERESMEFLEEQVIREETAMIIRKNIAQLSPQVRQVLELSMTGISNQEIADKLDITIHTVKSHKKKAYLLLRDQLKNLVVLLILISRF